MKNKQDIERRIDEVMDSVGNLQRAMPNPFFYTRLEARLMKEEKSFWERISRMITRPAIAAITVSLVLFLNTLVAIEGVRTEVEPEMTEVATLDDLHSTTFYDIENNQP